MGLKDRLQGDFPSLPPFADAIAAGVKDEMEPLMKEIEKLKEEITALKSRVALLGTPTP